MNDSDGPSDPPDPVGEGPFKRQICLIGNRLGLHARAAAKFVQTAEQFDADIWVVRNGMRVSGASILGLMMLAAGPGQEILVEACGKEAKAALDALVRLVEAKFDED